MKVTKKAKTVDVYYDKKEWTEYTSRFTCPTCKGQFHGFIRDKNVLRIKCNCGQELILKTRSNK